MSRYSVKSLFWGKALGLALLLAAWESSAWAVFEVSVTPERGGRDIRFDATRNGSEVQNQEVTFAVTTDQAKPYRITQSLFSSPTNESGVVLSEDAIRIFSPSNPSGTIHYKLPQNLVTGTEMIYTSDAAGSAESFVLSYALDAAKIPEPGIYVGQLTYTLEPTDGGVAPSTRTIQIRVQSEATFELRFANDAGQRSLDLGDITRQAPEGQESAVFEIRSGGRGAYRVYQEMNEPLSNESGSVIEPKLIRFETRALQDGEGVRGNRIQGSRQEIFRSGENGPSGGFEAVYTLSDAARLESGLYRSEITYWAEGENGEVLAEPFTVPMTVEVKPIFYMDVTLGERGEGLIFGSFDPRSPDGRRSQRTALKVYNNTGEKYQINQITSGPMRNGEGEPVPPDQFVFRAESPTLGEYIQSSTDPIREGESILYVSDGQGTAAEVIVYYDLQMPRDQKGGNYSTDFVYSLSSI